MQILVVSEWHVHVSAQWINTNLNLMLLDQGPGQQPIFTMQVIISCTTDEPYYVDNVFVKSNVAYQFQLNKHSRQHKSRHASSQIVVAFTKIGLYWPASAVDLNLAPISKAKTIMNN